MANLNRFPPTNFPGQARQPGHWAAYLLGGRQTPPPPTQQELNLTWANCLLDGQQPELRREEESSSDEDNIDPQLRMQNQTEPNLNMAPTQVLQPMLQTQGVPAPGQCLTHFRDPNLTSLLYNRLSNHCACPCWQEHHSGSFFCSRHSL